MKNRKYRENRKDSSLGYHEVQNAGKPPYLSRVFMSVILVAVGFNTIDAMINTFAWSELQRDYGT